MGYEAAMVWAQYLRGYLNEKHRIIEKIAESCGALVRRAYGGSTAKGKWQAGPRQVIICRGAEYFRRARRGGSSFRELGRLVMSLRRLYLSLVRVVRTDKLVADVETMFSAIADSIYNGQLSKLES